MRRVFLCLYRPLRGHARSHRYGAAGELDVIPAGAGVPAKRPARFCLLSPYTALTSNLWKIDTAHSSCGVRQPIHCS
ncbi:hypothetical protein E8E78_14640 [Pseudomonas sp. BN505]|nr:hypothetical protein [Pseudomonas sp. BN605]MDH4857823.1 hypothetical protein [Pseudomonas sp. BN505]